jgi:hypothetical protein
VSTAFDLRFINLLFIVLLLVRALSPLGGQSSLRLLHETNSTLSAAHTVYYSDAAATVVFNTAHEWFPIIPTVLGTSLAVSEEIKSRPVDLWSHPKVPRIDIVEQNVLENVAESKWICVDANTPKKYSSWTSINVQGLQPNKRASFEVKRNYMSLKCHKICNRNSIDAVKSQVPGIRRIPTPQSRR